MNTTGEKAKAFRKSLGLTQKEFTEWIAGHGIKLYKPEMVAAWENGRRYVPIKVQALIEIECEDEKEFLYRSRKSELADYTTDELLAELKRRIEEKE